MAMYCFTCDACGKEWDVICLLVQRDRNEPRTCDCGSSEKPYRDYSRERFGGVTYRSKGRYPLHDEDKGRVFDSYQDHKSYLEKNGLTWRDNNREMAYRHKHAQDRVEHRRQKLGRPEE